MATSSGSSSPSSCSGRELEHRAGSEIARLYGHANQAAIAWVVDEAIDCDLRRMPAYLWASTPDELRRVREEAVAAARLGVGASVSTRRPAR